MPRNSATLSMRLTQWFIFTILFGALPIIFHAFNILTTSGWRSIDYINLFSHGEIQIIAAALSAEAIGGLIISILVTRAKHPVYIIIAIGATAFILLVSAYWFSQIVLGPLMSISMDVSRHTDFQKMTANQSVCFFAITIVSCFGCKLLTEG